MLYFGKKAVNNIYIGKSKVRLERLPYTEDTRKLPDGYIGLDYLQSVNDAYINTDYIANQDTEIIAQFRTNATSTDGYVYGARTSTANAISGYAGSGSSNWRFSTFVTLPQGVVSLVDTEFETIQNNQGVTVNGTKYNYSGTVGTFNTTKPIWIFFSSGVTKANLNMPFNGKIRAVIIKENGKAVRDFKPCINPNGEYGMYDFVENKFYGNANKVGRFTDGSTSTTNSLETSMLTTNSLDMDDLLNFNESEEL